jgi:F0F1-type ATP synthase assembly protein I
MWASRVTSIGLCFSLPALAGYAVDRWLGSSPIGVLAGALIGFLTGMLQVLALARQVNDRPPRDNSPPSRTD